MPDSHLDYKLFYQRRLPHYQPQDSFFFITFRLAFSLPTHFLNAYSSYKKRLIHSIHEQANTEQKVQDRMITKKLFDYYDDKLSELECPVSLTGNNDVVNFLSDEIKSHHGKLYYLACHTIMPNHVHLLVRPLSKEDSAVSLSTIIKTIKGRSAKTINSILNRQGTLWSREYFDYWVRTDDEFDNIVNYIRHNPVRAKLVKEAADWRWTWINPDLL